MKIVELDLALHRGISVVLIHFVMDMQLASAIKQLSTCKWSQSLKTWYVPFSTEILYEIKNRIVKDVYCWFYDDILYFYLKMI